MRLAITPRRALCTPNGNRGSLRKYCYSHLREQQTRIFYRLVKGSGLHGLEWNSREVMLAVYLGILLIHHHIHAVCHKGEKGIQVRLFPVGAHLFPQRLGVGVI